MDAEASVKTGAGYGERSADRVTQRNGYRSRSWDTRVGTMELRIPKLRDGSYFPSLLEPRRRSEKVCQGRSNNMPARRSKSVPLGVIAQRLCPC